MLIPEDCLYVSFDAADTIIKLTKSVGEQYSNIAKTFGVNVEAGILEKRFRKIFASKAPLGADGQKGFDWWESLIEEVFGMAHTEAVFEEEYSLALNKTDFSNFDNFVETLYLSLASKNAWVYFDDVFPCLENLKNRKIKMIVFSNFDERLLDILKALNLSRFFEHVFCSTQIGYAKPDTKAFTLIAQVLKVKPNQILHVGDGFNNDYLGATRAGFKGVLLCRDKADLLLAQSRLADNEKFNLISTLAQLAQ